MNCPKCGRPIQAAHFSEPFMRGYCGDEEDDECDNSVEGVEMGTVPKTWSHKVRYSASPSTYDPVLGSCS